MASVSRSSRVLLVCALLVGACRSTEAAPVEHQPVQLTEPQRETVARFVGSWQQVSGEEDQAAAIEAVSAVTAEMNGLIRGVAQSRLEESVKIDATLEIAEAEGILTITRSGRTTPFMAPADGKVFDTVNEEGDEAKGSLKIDGDAIVTRVETEQGGGERTYRVVADGQLEISTRIFSPRLPGDVVYVAHYSRP